MTRRGQHSTPKETRRGSRGQEREREKRGRREGDRATRQYLGCRLWSSRTGLCSTTDVYSVGRLGGGGWGGVGAAAGAEHCLSRSKNKNKKQPNQAWVCGRFLYRVDLFRSALCWAELDWTEIPGLCCCAGPLWDLWDLWFLCGCCCWFTVDPGWPLSGRRASSASPRPSGAAPRP